MKRVSRDSFTNFRFLRAGFIAGFFYAFEKSVETRTTRTCLVTRMYSDAATSLDAARNGSHPRTYPAVTAYFTQSLTRICKLGLTQTRASVAGNIRYPRRVEPSRQGMVQAPLASQLTLCFVLRAQHEIETVGWVMVWLLLLIKHLAMKQPIRKVPTCSRQALRYEGMRFWIAFNGEVAVRRHS